MQHYSNFMSLFIKYDLKITGDLKIVQAYIYIYIHTQIHICNIVADNCYLHLVFFSVVRADEQKDPTSSQSAANSHIISVSA